MSFFLSLTAYSVLLCVTPIVSFSAEATQGESEHFSADAATLYDTASKAVSSSGADALIIESEEHVSFDAEGKTIRTRYYLYKILTQKGASEWANIGASWEPWHEERPTLRARVITPDYTVHSLDPQTISDEPSKQTADDLFSDLRVVRAPLPAVALGSLVEEEQVFKQNAPLFGGAVVERTYFSASVPIRHSRLVVEAPSALPLRYDIRSLPDLKPLRTDADGRVRIVFDSGPIDAVEDVDANLPSDVPAFSSVTFSTGISWQHRHLVSSDLEGSADGVAH